MIMYISIGQIVFSKAGRDKGRPLIVLNTEGEYLFLADGKNRLINNPKKKKKMHVQHTNIIVSEIADKQNSKIGLLDADVRKALKELSGESV